MERVDVVLRRFLMVFMVQAKSMEIKSMHSPAKSSFRRLCFKEVKKSIPKEMDVSISFSNEKTQYPSAPTFGTALAEKSLVSAPASR